MKVIKLIPLLVMLFFFNYGFSQIQENIVVKNKSSESTTGNKEQKLNLEAKRITSEVVPASTNKKYRKATYSNNPSRVASSKSSNRRIAQTLSAKPISYRAAETQATVRLNDSTSRKKSQETKTIKLKARLIPNN